MNADRPCDSEPADLPPVERRCRNCGALHLVEQPHGNLLFCGLCAPPNVLPFPYDQNERFDHLRDTLAASLEPRPIPGWKVWGVSVAIWAIIVGIGYWIMRR